MSLQHFERHVITFSERTGEAFRSRFGLWGIAAISFLESCLLIPIVTDPFLVAYVLANKLSALKGIVVTTLASVVGGAVAYLVAVGFFEIVVSPLISEASEIQFHDFVAQFEEGTFLLTLIGAVTPIPYTLVALAAGFGKGNFLLFMLASLLGRGARYGLVGWLTYRYGEHALQIARRRILFASVVMILLFVLYVLFKF